MFCNGDIDDGCWQLTLTTTRPLKLLYFDGSSGAKMRGGSLDAQDVLLWGGPVKHTVNLETQRICELCAWGKPLGLDGFVRMEMDLQSLPLADPERDYQQAEAPDPVQDSDSDGYTVNMRSGRTEFSTIEAGTWHSNYPGIAAYTGPYSRLTFYDPFLFPALSSFGVAKNDGDTESQELIDMGSGVDWRALFNVIVDRYAGRLELIHHLLDSGVDSTQVANRNHLWLLLRSIQMVNAEICRAVVQMWAKFRHVVQKWKEDVGALMKWLDWSVWVKCNPACSFEDPGMKSL
ncbi:hypothetical protein BDQ17DRAFT_1324035 [Cyathus striatus]|nr:hypothetical protein BDQ17DRAFT_1324035 [Cyathus striatus]